MGFAPASRLLRSLFDSNGRASQQVLAMLKELYPMLDTSNGLSFKQVLLITRHWVTTNRDKRGPGEKPVQRWEASRLPETQAVDEERLTSLIMGSGFFHELYYRLFRTPDILVRDEILTFRPAFANLALVGGGKIARGHWPQLVRLNELFRLYEIGWRFNTLVLQVGNRVLGSDELDWSWAREAQAAGESVVGLRFLPGVGIPDLAEGTTEFDAMSQLWRIVEKPAGLENFEPEFLPNVKAWLTKHNAGVAALVMMLISVNPHQFQGIINARELPVDSMLYAFFASAQLARHDLDYLLDGLRRHWGAVAKMSGIADNEPTEAELRELRALLGL